MATGTLGVTVEEFEPAALEVIESIQFDLAHQHTPRVPHLRHGVHEGLIGLGPAGNETAQEGGKSVLDPVDGGRWVTECGLEQGGVVIQLFEPEYKVVKAAEAHFHVVFQRHGDLSGEVVGAAIPEVGELGSGIGEMAGIAVAQLFTEA